MSPAGACVLYRRLWLLGAKLGKSAPGGEGSRLVACLGFVQRGALLQTPDRGISRFGIISESWNWAWSRSLKSPIDCWDSGEAGLEKPDGPLLNQLREDFCEWASGPNSELPEMWKIGRAAFIPKFTSRDVAAYRPIEPPNPVMRAAMPARVRDHEASLQPRRINAEGFRARRRRRRFGLGGASPGGESERMGRSTHDLQSGSGRLVRIDLLRRSVEILVR